MESTKLIQIGFSLSNAQGEQPLRPSTWQFHLHFDLGSENVERDSIEMLQSAGIDFDRLRKEGIPQRKFA